MATSAIVDIGRLEEGWILAPERYDPRRGGKLAGPCLGDFVNVRREVLSPQRGSARGGGRFVVFDTGDARDGIVVAHKTPCAAADIRSAKKIVRPHQVIISRLRPYLRQVAWIDPGLLAEQAQDVQLLCSTEFFVLEPPARGREGVPLASQGPAKDASIAFLVPFLLSTPVQAVLAAAQEGGHHPRFNERTLTTLPVPVAMVQQAGELSARVERAVRQAREAYCAVRESIGTATSLHP